MAPNFFALAKARQQTYPSLLFPEGITDRANVIESLLQAQDLLFGAMEQYEAAFQLGEGGPHFDRFVQEYIEEFLSHTVAALAVLNDLGAGIGVDVMDILKDFYEHPAPDEEFSTFDIAQSLSEEID